MLLDSSVNDISLHRTKSNIKDVKHNSFSQVGISDLNRRCHRPHDNVHTSGKMHRAISDVHHAFIPKLRDLGKRMFTCDSLIDRGLTSMQEPMPVSSSTVSECYPSEWIAAYQTANHSSIVPAMSPLVCPLSWETVMTAPGNYVACCPPYVPKKAVTTRISANRCGQWVQKDRSINHSR